METHHGMTSGKMECYDWTEESTEDGEGVSLNAADDLPTIQGNTCKLHLHFGSASHWKLVSDWEWVQIKHSRRSTGQNETKNINRSYNIDYIRLAQIRWNFIDPELKNYKRTFAIIRTLSQSTEEVHIIPAVTIIYKTKFYSSFLKAKLNLKPGLEKVQTRQKVK